MLKLYQAVSDRELNDIIHVDVCRGVALRRYIKTVRRGLHHLEPNVGAHERAHMGEWP